MKLVGDVETDGTVRIEGTVTGNVRAGKAVVIGKDGCVEGSVITQDAVISGRLIGKLTAESRLELQATSRIEGEVFARRMQLEEGAVLNGTMHMGDRKPATMTGGDSDERKPAQAPAPEAQGEQAAQAAQLSAPATPERASAAPALNERPSHGGHDRPRDLARHSRTAGEV